MLWELPPTPFLGSELVTAARYGLKNHLVQQHHLTAGKTEAQRTGVTNSRSRSESVTEQSLGARAGCHLPSQCPFLLSACPSLFLVPGRLGGPSPVSFPPGRVRKGNCSVHNFTGSISWAHSWKHFKGHPGSPGGDSPTGGCSARA